MEGQSATAETEKSQALLWAIVEFRQTLDRLIEEQKTLILSLAAESPSVAPGPPAAETYSVDLPPVHAAPTPPAADPEPPPRARPAAVPTRNTPREYRRPNPTPAAPPQPPSPDPIEPPAQEPARPEDARQRLDALAAKLLDRRLKQTAGDPHTRPAEG